MNDKYKRVRTCKKNRKTETIVSKVGTTAHVIMIVHVWQQVRALLYWM